MMDSVGMTDVVSAWMKSNFGHVSLGRHSLFLRRVRWFLFALPFLAEGHNRSQGLFRSTACG